MKLFWFSKIGTKDSFSRISESILPILKKNNYELYTIIPHNVTLNNEKLFKNILRMGNDINEGGLELKEKHFMGPMKSNLGSKMKYIILQSLAHCQAENIKILMITMGVYEADWFMETLEQIKNTKTANFLLKDVKIVLYVPFDYIPSLDTIKHLLKADTILTTVPYILDYLPLDGWIGHANDSVFHKLSFKRKHLIKMINNMNSFWSGEKINIDDVIILNANLFGERKRIDITVKAFEHVLNKFPNKKLKLWLHGGYNESLDIPDKVRKRLITSRKIKNHELNLIYNICQIGINTSWGEGWSLTNCEHASTGALQVVPNWLACKFHFSDNRGLLIDVNEVESVNEAGKKVIIGVPKQDSANQKLEEAVQNFEKWDPTLTKKYVNSYTWEKECLKLTNFL